MPNSNDGSKPTNIVDRLILKPHALRKLAGDEISEQDILDTIDEDEFFKNLSGDTVSVEILTLEQYRYESAFDFVMSKNQELNISIDDLTEMVEKTLPRFKSIKPHMQVVEVGIIAIVDVKKIDADTVNYVSNLLAKIPKVENGFIWNYLEEQ